MIPPLLSTRLEYRRVSLFRMFLQGYVYIYTVRLRYDRKRILLSYLAVFFPSVLADRSYFLCFVWFVDFFLFHFLL